MAQEEIVGLIPAAGLARRISPLPCSKELLPVGFHQTDKNNDIHLKAVSHYLLERMRLAEISRVYLILRKGKWDIPAYFADGKIVNLHIAYLMMDLPYGVPYTLDQAYLFIKNSTVLFGFPDIIFEPQDAFKRLLKKREQTDATLILGLFPSEQPKKADMVEFDKNGRIKEIYIKSDSTNLTYAWIIAVWGPDFTEFLHEYIKENKKALNRIKAYDDSDSVREIFLGEVIQDWIRKNLKIDYVLFKKGNYIDIGTTDDLVKAINEKRT